MRENIEKNVVQINGIYSTRWLQYNCISFKMKIKTYSITILPLDLYSTIQKSASKHKNLADTEELQLTLMINEAIVCT